MGPGSVRCSALVFIMQRDYLTPCQQKAGALNWPVKTSQSNIRLVAHPVGFLTSLFLSRQVYGDSPVVSNVCMNREKGFTPSCLCIAFARPLFGLSASHRSLS